MFSFAPDNLPQNAEVMTDRQGKAFEVPSEAAPARFAGIQGQAWSEVMRSDAQFEYMAYPRLLALAERAWHRAGWNGLIARASVISWASVIWWIARP